jgi:hypothetical protein
MSCTWLIARSGGKSVLVVSYAIVKLVNIAREKISVKKSFALPNSLAFDRLSYAVMFWVTKLFSIFKLYIFIFKLTL